MYIHNDYERAIYKRFYPIIIHFAKSQLFNIFLIQSFINASFVKHYFIQDVISQYNRKFSRDI